MTLRSATALACSNIALAKYWGKSSLGDNLTAVPSLSLTLAELRTTTRVRFDAALASDSVQLGLEQQQGRPRERVVRLLDAVRALAGIRDHAEVVSSNDFPTASGLASSASGFAALALAAQAAAGLSLPTAEVSRLARRASASAARSLYPGFVELLAEAHAATPVAGSDWMDVQMVIAATTLGPKATGSTEGMLHTQATSPYYPAWLAAAPGCFEQAKRALLERDLEALGTAMEHSTLLMHASMLAARPGLLYFLDVTLRVLERVRELRKQGTPAFYTMDAGPHVKVLTDSSNVHQVRSALAEVPGVQRVITSRPGPGAQLLALE
ncbi:MAG TPA: diphosphomevalonate decarboxylase [Polyangiaceae bacterium]|nr:diphosphomevalonate decarboxylase [Polyangiaceae bacterium]